MSERGKVPLPLLPTAVPGLDEVLGGGLPEYSFNLIAGAPGAGKTTLAHQIMFANATAERAALYVTLLGEPPLKMLRYQQQLDFFDPVKVGSVIHFVNLAQPLLEHGLRAVLDRIIKELTVYNPGLVFVESFQTVTRVRVEPDTSDLDLQSFVERLALHLTAWQATTFLIGEYAESALRDNPVLTIADGILWMTQSVEQNSIVRKLQVVKTRGQAALPGLHTFRISQAGLRVFPRILGSTPADLTAVHHMERPAARPRLSTGVAGLDEMMAGGIPVGTSVLVSGPSGSGKSALATQFIAAGVQQGEPGVIALFEERPDQYLQRANDLGINLTAMVQQRQVQLVALRPLDLSPDEILQEIQAAVVQMQAQRVVIDSLTGFEVVVAPTFREEFRQSLYRLVETLGTLGVTTFTVMEVPESSTNFRFSPKLISFLTDTIIMQRYVEIEGQLGRVLAVVKMRTSAHSKELRRYDVTTQGVVIGDPLTEYEGIITGIARARGPRQ